MIKNGDNMKEIKVCFFGYNGYDIKRSHLYKSMNKQFHVDVTESPEDAEYLICGVLGEKYEYCKYPQVRIMYEGENYIPDFNLIDYGIFNYPLKLFDRSFYFPFCIDEYGHCESLQYKTRDYDKSIFLEKPFFCNFIAGHESENGIRGAFFKKLSNYKRVESPGKYLNNMEHGETVAWDDGSKVEFQKKCKFTLCFESTKHEGFVTEKITDAFYADTIPIYYGSDTVKDIFNPQAFINAADYQSFDDLLSYIIELDNDDNKYLDMLRQPIFNDPAFPDKKLKEFDEYVYYIFSQPLDKAKRRSEVYSAKGFDVYLSKARVSQLNKLKEKKRYYLSLVKRKLREKH